MRSAQEIRRRAYVLWFHHPTLGPPIDDHNGTFLVAQNAKAERPLLAVMVSNADGWEHVSVSLERRCPTWEEMDFIARLYWRDDEVPVQYHVGGEKKVNTCERCLHLWRKVGVNPELPPRDFV